MAALLFVALGAGGGATETATVPLAWQFADGRSCLDAGAFTVTVAAGGRLVASLPCAAALAPASVSIDAVPLPGDLDFSAESAQGLELYHGKLHLDDVPTA